MSQLREVLESNNVDCSELRPLFKGSRRNVLSFPVGGGDAAMQWWRWFRERVPQTGHWPVVLGSESEAIGNAADVESIAKTDVAEVLLRTSSITLPAWFDAHRRELAEERFDPGEPVDDALPADGDWPADPQPNHSFTTPFDVVTGEAYERVLIALVPTSVSWEVPAYLAFGGWNDCPLAEEHCAVHRYWHDRHGAEIVAATRDIIEMVVTSPPASPMEALALAREQYVYCEDIVNQGTQTIAQLAGALLGGTAWYFWWD